MFRFTLSVVLSYLTCVLLVGCTGGSAVQPDLMGPFSISFKSMRMINSGSNGTDIGLDAPGGVELRDFSFVLSEVEVDGEAQTRETNRRWALEVLLPRADRPWEPDPQNVLTTLPLSDFDDQLVSFPDTMRGTSGFLRIMLTYDDPRGPIDQVARDDEWVPYSWTNCPVRPQGLTAADVTDLGEFQLADPVNVQLADRFAGGVGPYQYFLSMPLTGGGNVIAQPNEVPLGLALAADGALTGTAAAPGTYSFKVGIVDGCANNRHRVITFNLRFTDPSECLIAPVLSDLTSLTGTVGVPFSSTGTVAGSGTITVTAATPAGGALPAWLTFGVTGARAFALTGTPPSAQNVTVRLTAVDNCDPPKSAFRDYTLVLSEPDGGQWNPQPAFGMYARATNDLSMTLIDGKPALVWVGDADFATVPGLLCAVATVPDPDGPGDWVFSEVVPSFGVGSSPRGFAPAICEHNGRLAVAFLPGTFNEWRVGLANVATPSQNTDWTIRNGPLFTPAGFPGNLIARSYNDRLVLLIGHMLSISTGATPDGPGSWESHRLTSPDADFWVQSALTEWEGRLGAVLFDTRNLGGSQSRYHYFRAQAEFPALPGDWDSHVLPMSEQGANGFSTDSLSHHAALIVRSSGEPAVSVGIRTGANLMDVTQRLWLANDAEPASAADWTVTAISNGGGGGFATMVERDGLFYVAFSGANAQLAPASPLSFPFTVGTSFADPTVPNWIAEDQESHLNGTEPWIYRIDDNRLGVIYHRGAGNAGGALSELGVRRIVIPN